MLQVLREQKVRKVLRDFRASREMPALKVLRDFRASRATQVLQALQVLRVPQAPPDPQDLQEARELFPTSLTFTATISRTFPPERTRFSLQTAW